MRRTSLALALVLVAPALAGNARAQPYPLTPDASRSRSGPLYQTQGPLPLQQQGVGEETQRGLGVPKEKRAQPGPEERLGSFGAEPLLSDPAKLPFTQGAELPRGVKTATVRALPGGGLEYYLRIPPGGRIPESWQPSAKDVTFLRGDATLVGDRGQPLRSEPGTHLSLPANTAHAFACSRRQECLLFVRSAGPSSVHYTNPDEAPRR